MTETMVDRVARAISPEWFDDPAGPPSPDSAPDVTAYHRLKARQRARAAIEAMRIPNDAMMEGAWRAMPSYVGEVSDRHIQEAITSAIDAALSETEGG